MIFIDAFYIIWIEFKFQNGQFIYNPNSSILNLENGKKPFIFLCLFVFFVHIVHRIQPQHLHYRITDEKETKIR